MSDTRPFARYKGPNELSNNEFKDFLNHLELKTWKPKLVTLHHTFSPTLREWRGKDPKTGKIPSLDALERFYHLSNHWHAGPHFFVSDVAWYVFSEPTKPGVHAVSYNANAWGIEVVHNGDEAPFSGEQAKTLYRGVADIFHRLGLDPRKDLRFHRDDPKTAKSCPGLKVSKAAVLNGILAYYAPQSPKVDPHPEDAPDVPIYLGGKLLAFKGIRVDGVTYASLRPLAGALGATVDYRPGLHPYIGVHKQDVRVDLTGQVDIKKGESWVSVRAVGESLGYLVAWHSGVHIEPKKG